MVVLLFIQRMAYHLLEGLIWKLMNWNVFDLKLTSLKQIFSLSVYGINPRLHQNFYRKTLTN